MKPLTNTEFKILLKNAIANQFCANEYIVYNDSHEDFYFYVDTKKQFITDQGIALTGDQYEMIVDLAVKKYQEDNPDTEPFNHMEEYGINNQMFI